GTSVMHKAAKITLISVGSLFGLFLLILLIGFIGMAAGIEPEESGKPATAKPVAQKSSAKPARVKPSAAQPTVKASSKPTTTKPSTKPTQSKDERQAAQVAALRTAIEKELGTSNRDGVTRLSTVKLSRGELTVKWAINDSLTENLVKTSARIDVKGILAAVKASNVDPSVITLRGSFSMQDTYGNVSEDVVMTLTYFDSTLAKMQLANMTND